jgi:hypothetical protein
MDWMSEQKTKKTKELNESSGGYMSVDRDKALDRNWDTLVKITRPLARPDESKSPRTESEKKPTKR